MVIRTSDGKRLVDVGTSDTLKSVYSTIVLRLGRHAKAVPDAIAFLQKGTCAPGDALETARQFNLIRDDLARVSPDKAVYDLDEPRKKAPWAGNISPVVTSCANLYTTADGKDLLFEIVSILTYAGIAEVAVAIGEG